MADDMVQKAVQTYKLLEDTIEKTMVEFACEEHKDPQRFISSYIIADALGELVVVGEEVHALLEQEAEGLVRGEVRGLDELGTRPRRASRVGHAAAAGVHEHPGGLVEKEGRRREGGRKKRKGKREEGREREKKGREDG